MSVSLNGTNGLTFADSTTQNTGGYTGFRNRLINGAMMIDQRNAGASVTPGDGAYTLDRWQCGLSQPSKYSVQQNAAAVTPPAGFSNYFGVTSLSAYTVTGNDNFSFWQVVEGFNIADFNWGTASAVPATLSFWVRSSLIGTFGGSLATTNGAIWSLPFTYTISAANTWTYISIAVTAGTNAVPFTNNGAGVYVRFGLGCSGTSAGGTSGVWTNNNYTQPAGTVSVVGTSGATFYITGVQLEKGSVATPFEFRPYGTELQLCQRYYAKSYAPETAPGTSVDGPISVVVSSAYAFASFGPVRFPATMRSTPTVTIYSDNGTSGNLNYVGVGNYAVSMGAGVTPNGFSTVAHSALSAGWCGRGHYVATAEL